MANPPIAHLSWPEPSSSGDVHFFRFIGILGTFGAVPVWLYVASGYGDDGTDSTLRFFFAVMFTIVSVWGFWAAHDLRRWGGGEMIAASPGTIEALRAISNDYPDRFVAKENLRPGGRNWEPAGSFESRPANGASPGTPWEIDAYKPRRAASHEIVVVREGDRTYDAVLMEALFEITKRTFYRTTLESAASLKRRM